MLQFASELKLWFRIRAASRDIYPEAISHNDINAEASKLHSHCVSKLVQ